MPPNNSFCRRRVRARFRLCVCKAEEATVQLTSLGCLKVQTGNIMLSAAPRRAQLKSAPLLSLWYPRKNVEFYLRLPECTPRRSSVVRRRSDSFALIESLSSHTSRPALCVAVTVVHHKGKFHIDFVSSQTKYKSFGIYCMVLIESLWCFYTKGQFHTDSVSS